MHSIAAGAVSSPNIWRHPDVYEVENRAVDPDGIIESVMSALRPWDGACVLDVGCGTGFHLPRLAVSAAQVTGVEPHGALVRRARRRSAALPNVRVLQGAAQALPIPDRSVDVVQARWAYFFGPGCEPGLAQVHRVLRRGGACFVVDLDATRSTFGSWFRRALPAYDSGLVEHFWARQGFAREQVSIRWAFDSRADFEAVLGIEFDPAVSREIAAVHTSLEVDYAVNIWWHLAR